MHKILLCILLLSFSQANAAVLTVNNNNPSPGQYTSFNAAEIAANDGDTIYLSGSNASYGDINIGKRLIIIGSGFNPDKQNPLISYVNRIIASYSGTESILSGLTILSQVEIAGWPGVPNITFEKCFWPQSSYLQAFWIKYYSTIHLSGCLIQRDFLVWSTDNNITKVKLANCVIQGSLGNIGLGAIGFEGHILNCLFLGNGSTPFCSYVQLFTIENSILVGVDPAFSASSSSYAFNNIVYAANNTNFNTGVQSGNLTGNPLFVSVGNTYSGYHPANDYHLQNTSPGHLAGTDGTDIGLYGGKKYYTTAGEPEIPQIRAFNVPSIPVPAGSNITIDFTSTVKP